MRVTKIAPARRLSPWAMADGAGRQGVENVADRGHVPQERDAGVRDEVEPDGDEDLVAAARVERGVRLVGIAEVRGAVQQHESGDEQPGEDEPADGRDRARRPRVACSAVAVIPAASGRRVVREGFELLEDPQQVERSRELPLPAPVSGHDALQSPVGGAEEFDRQVHRAPPLDRPTLAGERPADPGQAFQSTFQSEVPYRVRGLAQSQPRRLKTA